MRHEDHPAASLVAKPRQQLPWVVRHDTYPDPGTVSGHPPRVSDRGPGDYRAQPAWRCSRRVCRAAWPRRTRLGLRVGTTRLGAGPTRVSVVLRLSPGSVKPPSAFACFVRRRGGRGGRIVARSICDPAVNPLDNRHELLLERPWNRRRGGLRRCGGRRTAATARKPPRHECPGNQRSTFRSCGVTGQARPSIRGERRERRVDELGGGEPLG